MATGPFQSKLYPYFNQIVALRACSPPATYARIAAILKEQHQINVTRGTIQNFVKVRGKRTLYQAVSQKGKIPTGKRPTTGKISAEVQARLDTLKQQAAPAEEQPKPYLPPDGRLTYKEKP